MKELRAAFTKCFPELKDLNHMNDIAKVMLVVDYSLLIDKVGIRYNKSEQQIIKNACKEILGIGQ